MFDEKKLAELKEAVEKWERGNAPAFAKELKKEFVCESGIPVKRVYTPLDLAEKGFDYLKDLGLPGNYPYTRCNTPLGYRSGMWGTSEYAGWPTPEQSNELWKHQIAAGQNMVYIAYDLPSQLGYDPDSPMSEGEVGRVGVSLCSLRDWETAFDGIDIDKVMVSEVINAPAIIAVACHLALAQERGIEFKVLTGSCQNDILKEYVARGNFIFPPVPSMRLTTDILSYCGENLPRYLPITVSFVHQAQTGANPVHHIAFALADAFCYFQYAVQRGIDIDLIAPLVMFLGCNEYHDFFQQIAKFRAMRKIYSRVMRDRFKAKKPESLAAKFYSGNSGTDYHKEQYMNNIIRGALACLVGALAGVQICDVRAYDEQFGIPTKQALLTSLRTQQVVFYETGVADTVDPLAGSYFVECLTLEFEERVTKELEEIERQGTLECIENGYFRRTMAEDAYKWHKRFERGDIVRVGVNRFQSADEERPTTIMRADSRVAKQRVESVQELRRRRDNGKVKRALDEVKAVANMKATAQNNLMPPVLEAVKAYTTYGEICDALREIWGEWKEPVTI